MEGFDYHDIILLLVTIGGAYLASRKIDKFPEDNSWARYTFHLHMSTVIGIFSLIATTNKTGDVEWMMKVGIPMPLLSYGIILAFGIGLFMTIIVESSLTKITNRFFFYLVTILECIIDIGILIHILKIT